MIPVFYFRSSSFNAWQYCQHSYFLRYTLGLDDISNIKADKGNITHKALELLAAKKLAIQNGANEFFDEESNRKFNVVEFSPQDAINTGWDCYTKLKPRPHKWTDIDLIDCTAWMYKAMEFNNGEFNPLKRTIHWPEKYFDFVIDKPWAKYSYKIGDQKIDGQLALKGTIDLVCNNGNNIYEMVDWKTGKRLDWATGKVKEYADLREDSQLRIYHYALSKLLPNARKIYVTIVYINDGGPFPLPYDKSDLPKTEKMIKERFDEIRSSPRPKLIYPDWKCEKLCHFGKTKWENSEKTKCKFIKDEIFNIGLDKVITKYGDSKIRQSYGSGGGQTNRN